VRLHVGGRVKTSHMCVHTVRTRDVRTTFPYHIGDKRFVSTIVF
jgi:hypothetical protein